MANLVKFYFYSPTWDIPPGGPLQIGNVLKSIETPTEPISRVLPPDTLKLEKTEVVIAPSAVENGRFTILARFLSFCELSGGASFETSNASRHSIDRIVTEEILFTDDQNVATAANEVPPPHPRDVYWQQCINMPRVKAFLKSSKCKKPVYVVTGIKTVYGGSAASLASSSRGRGIGGGLDGAAATGGAVPLALGAGASLGGGESLEASWGGSNPFVLAFRVRRLTAERATGEVVDKGDYNKGAKLGCEGEGEQSKGPDVQFLVSTAEDADDEGYDKAEVTEGYGSVFCAFCKEAPWPAQDLSPEN
ncbi:hypothetical protein RB595_004359 [Gaeumannomyces hyphopodioides]